MLRPYRQTGMFISTKAPNGVAIMIQDALSTPNSGRTEPSKPPRVEEVGANSVQRKSICAIDLQTTASLWLGAFAG